ncbi:PriCT-2 domain-containing protein [Silanimonas sp.]|uniref:PriCT-2 domain-containing protein n=1 Tax=Silanimonas sp. TaxID=1929290 RepID=UPI0022C12D35|nr:PriCT-2 domain-containing protein [Silanimonas sp.]MCZ8165770.1 toprim domain-containing protein [Silanimonas sp.]
MKAPSDLDRARDALRAIDPSCTRDDWIRVGMAARAAGLSFEDWDSWSATGSNYSARAAASAWRSFKGSGIGPGTLYALAFAAGWRPRGGHQQAPHRARAKAVLHNQRVVPEQPHKPLTSEELLRFNTLGPVSGAALTYLQARLCVVPPADGDLRCHHALRHWPTGHIGPALVALVTDAATREPISMHFTWVCPDGSKANIDRPRLLLGGHRKAGGVIRLWADDAVTTSLGIAEGVETALSLAHAHMPVWACIDAGNLAAFPVLHGIESLLIAADHDPAGLRAADSCAQRWARAGREVRIVRAPAAGQDMNDVARCEA